MSRLFCTQCGSEIGGVELCPKCMARNEFLGEPPPSSGSRNSSRRESEDFWSASSWSEDDATRTGVKSPTAAPFPPAAGGGPPPEEDEGTLILEERDEEGDADGATFILDQAESRPVLATLTRQSPPDLDRTYALYRGTMTVGTSGTDIELERKKSRAVSRRHASIESGERGAGYRFVLTDLGSSNGTFVNGRRVADAVELSNGDILKFGDVEFRFQTKVDTGAES